MIGMSWALINMTPYLIVVIYCWYRVRIPGLLVASFRNVQLLLRVVCAGLIMVQAFTTNSLTENFVCPHEYTGELGNAEFCVKLSYINFVISSYFKPKLVRYMS